MPPRFPLGLAVLAVLLVGSLIGAVASSSSADWDAPVLTALLLAAAFFGDRFEVQSTSRMRIVGSFPAYVLAMVLLGPAPAVLIGVVVNLAQQRRWEPTRLLVNLATYAAFPLAGGLLARTIEQHAALAPDSPGFALLVATVFLLAGVLNFTIVAAARCVLDGHRFGELVASSYLPLLSSQVLPAVLTALIAYLYAEIGAVAIIFAVAILFAYQRQQSQLIESRHNFEAARDSNGRLADANDQLAEANRQLVGAQLGLVVAMVNSIGARDQMTARHSAAVARYARAIAQAAGCSPADQELVHTAGLLHDVGKAIFTDAILFSAAPLSDDEWALIKRHPAQGAEIVGSMPGYGPVAEIIFAHHERIDGAGYPSQLAGDEIPYLARMIAIADTYDVMTARDSYREPTTHAKAIAELRRVAGTQLDSELVETFIVVLNTEDLAFQHGDDIDFNAELDLERRVREHTLGEPAALAA